MYSCWSCFDLLPEFMFLDLNNNFTLSILPLPVSLPCFNMFLLIFWFNWKCKNASQTWPHGLISNRVTNMVSLAEWCTVMDKNRRKDVTALKTVLAPYWSWISSSVHSLVSRHTGIRLQQEAMLEVIQMLTMVPFLFLVPICVCVCFKFLY